MRVARKGNLRVGGQGEIVTTSLSVWINIIRIYGGKANVWIYQCKRTACKRASEERCNAGTDIEMEQEEDEQEVQGHGEEE